MVVTSSAFLMVKMPVYQVVRMIAMGNCLMPASRAMLVASGMACALVILNRCGILGADCDRMLIDMVRVGMVQVAIMKVISMSLVLDCDVPALGAMFV